MLIANTLYGPSYVSFSTALHYYGLIDDMSQNIWSATIKRTKHYSTPLGAFEYLYMPQEYYSIGITQVRAEDYSFLIATPEKALCDIMNVLTYLEEDLRFDMDHISSLDPGILKECAKCGIKSNSIQQIIKLVQS